MLSTELHGQKAELSGCDRNITVHKVKYSYYLAFHRSTNPWIKNHNHLLKDPGCYVFSGLFVYHCSVFKIPDLLERDTDWDNVGKLLEVLHQNKDVL